MKYFFIRKDVENDLKGSAVSKALGLFKVYVDFTSEYRDSGFPGQPGSTRRGDNYIEVDVDDSVTCEQIKHILDKFGYEPATTSPK